MLENVILPYFQQSQSDDQKYIISQPTSRYHPSIHEYSRVNTFAICFSKSGQTNDGGGNRNTAIALIATTAVAIAETKILSKRTKRFKKTEQELEEMCVAKGVEYVPPELNEANHRTQARRRKLRDLCDPEEADSRKQKRTKTTSQESREKHAARMSTSENKKKTALRMSTPENKKKTALRMNSSENKNKNAKRMQTPENKKKTAERLQRPENKKNCGPNEKSGK